MQHPCIKSAAEAVSLFVGIHFSASIFDLASEKFGVHKFLVCFVVEQK